MTAKDMRDIANRVHDNMGVDINRVATMCREQKDIKFELLDILEMSIINESCSIELEYPNKVGLPKLQKRLEALGYYTELSVDGRPVLLIDWSGE